VTALRMFFVDTLYLVQDFREVKFQSIFWLEHRVKHHLTQSERSTKFPFAYNVCADLIILVLFQPD